MSRVKLFLVRTSIQTLQNRRIHFSFIRFTIFCNFISKYSPLLSTALFLQLLSTWRGYKLHFKPSPSYTTSKHTTLPKKDISRPKVVSALIFKTVFAILKSLVLPKCEMKSTNSMTWGGWAETDELVVYLNSHFMSSFKSLVLFSGFCLREISLPDDLFRDATLNSCTSLFR